MVLHGQETKSGYLKLGSDLMFKWVSLMLHFEVFISYTFDIDFNRFLLNNSKYNIHEDWMGLDIVPKSIKTFSEVWSFTNVITWNGKVCMEWVILHCCALTAKPMKVCYNSITKKVEGHFIFPDRKLSKIKSM